MCPFQPPDSRLCADSSNSLENVLATNHAPHQQRTPDPPLHADTTPPHLQVRVILDRGVKDYRYGWVSVDPGNQGVSLILQLQRIRSIRETGLWWVLTTLWDALNMRQDAIWLVSASIVSNLRP